MIHFKNIELSDRDNIVGITMKSPRRNCDLSFSNLCSWRFLYDTQYAIKDGLLFFKFWANGELAYMMPVGDGDLKQGVIELIQDSHKENKPFRMLGVCQNMRSDLEAILPNKFAFVTSNDYADYLYLREDLINLKGKKFQSKRNHINKFKKLYPDYEYDVITPENIDECLKLEEEWCKVNDCHKFEGTGNERRALTYALKNFNQIELTGGLIRVNGKIIAFTFGMPINEDTFGTHVEKADTTIEGAYNIINQEFAKHIPEQYTYINREEDLGIPGLRKAKESYNPVILLKKSVVNLINEGPVDPLEW